LGDASFLAKAPAQVVEKEQARLQDLRASVAELLAQVDKIRAL
jgi:valyl-tRNA synthetase